MNFYCYIPKEGYPTLDPLFPNCSLGTAYKRIYRDKYKSIKMLKQYGLPKAGWRIYSFSNFYDNQTFKFLGTY